MAEHASLDSLVRQYGAKMAAAGRLPYGDGEADVLLDEASAIAREIGCRWDELVQQLRTTILVAQDLSIAAKTAQKKIGEVLGHGNA